ncbi:MAG: hypothetical protein IPP99_06525 [Chitinophagaceae bacterium]|nr:hypothetical protein [Chitinophagaceae bacterium]MBP6588927.1 hypothetical protein [Chitinophagaceae bacterium]
MTTPQPTEEIDLLRLLERGIRFFRQFKWIFLTALLAGIVGGWFMYSKVIPVTYKSRLVLHSNILTNPEQIQIVNNWNKLLKQQEYSSLAQALGCGPEILYRTKGLTAKEIQQAFTPTNPNGFTIDAIVTDQSILDSLQSALLNGFDKGSYIKQRLEIKKANLTELIIRTREEISKLDSTKKNMEALIGGYGHSSSSVIIDGTSINRQLIEMHEKLLGYQESLRFTSAVYVLQGFSQFNKPDNPKLLPWLFIGVFVCMSLAIAFALLSSLLKKLKNRSAASHL